jgi:predicted transcriptional regulator
MAAILMPASLYRQITDEEMNALGVKRSELATDRPKLQVLIRRLARRCGVSQQAASIRLETLTLVPQPGSVSFILEALE